MSSSDSPDERDADEDTRTRTSVAERREGQPDALSVSDIATDRLPREIGKYRVTGYLGRGGMGVVLSAHDTELERPVALKLLHSTLGDKARSRMEREAQAMAKLAHPNVVTVHEFGRAGELRFIAMELVTGLTLREWFRREKSSWRKRLAVMVAAGRGLAAAHAAGLVHRDFKPENVLVGADERPRVTDFGLVASSVNEGEGIGARDGHSVMGGTPAYMPPEQWGDSDVDARADQFAFAVTCWEALWGRRPFRANGAHQRHKGSSLGDPERIRDRAGVPRGVEVALRRALQSDRQRRWPELKDLLDRLERIARDRRATVAAIAALPVAAVAVLAFRAGGSSAESPCHSAGGQVGAIWSSARIAQLRAAYARRAEPEAGGVWMDTEIGLQSWADEHRAMRIEACEIGRGDGRGVREVSAQRKACLDQRLAIFGALISELEQPDSTTLWYSRAAVHGLPRSTGCRSVTLSEPMATGEQVPPRDTLTEEHVQIARATALRALGKPRDAVSVAKNVAKVADSLGWSPLVAEAYLELGLGYQAMQDATAGEDALRRAVWFADASRDDVVRFQATIGLSDTAIDQADYDDAHRMIESARMIARRLPEDGDRNVSLEFQEAALAFWRGDFTGCVERSRAALPVVERSVGRNSVLGARLRLNLWRCLSALGRTSELEEPLKQALAIIDATTGREHPLAADALSGLGSLAREQKRAAEGLALFQEALAIRERIFGPENPECAKLHNNIGNVLVDLGRHDEARRSLERALSIWERAFGADGPAVATASNNLGHLAMKEGDPKAAEAHYRRALEIRRKKRPPGHSETLKTLVYLGRALTAQKNSASLPLLREAMAGYQTAEATPAERDAAKFELGRALYELGDDRVGGREAMEAACAAYDAKNDPFDCRAYLTKLAAKLAR